MIPTEFKYSDEASYQAGGVFKTKDLDLINQDIVVNSQGSFKVMLPNIFSKYILPHISSDAIVKKWSQDWMYFWQNQLHFAIWCATTGCGVDFNHHLNKQDNEMVGSVFRFHVYYPTRRILKEINAALPQDPDWNAFDNNYNRSAYERICSEFGVDVHTDWRQKKDDNLGQGG